MSIFPVHFNFTTVAGVGMSMATVAASVGMGFAYGRRLSVSGDRVDRTRTEDLNASIEPSVVAVDAPNGPSKSAESQLPIAQSELQPSPPMASNTQPSKRKTMHEHDENNNYLGYPYNLQSIYPNKRSRTPPEGGVEDGTIKESAGEITRPCTPQPDLAASKKAEERGSVTEPKTPEVTVPATPRPMKPLRSPKGFASYSGGSASPFKSAILTPKSTSIVSPSPSSSISWLQDITAETSPSSSAGVFGSRATPAAPVRPTPTPVSHSTGEESENVELELKGVKLYIKRGTREFGTGMLGHVKVLGSRETLEERILFRRDPLWQVSMNTRLTPFVKCSFNEDDCVLRIVAVEESTEKCTKSDTQIPKCGNNVSETLGNGKEVVVYALKPGRSCTKADFEDFAVSLMASSSLQAKQEARVLEEGEVDESGTS